jgi:MFS family permease
VTATVLTSVTRHYLGTERGPGRQMLLRSFLTNIAYGLTIAFVPVYLDRAARLSPGGIGLALSAGGLVQFLVTPYVGRLADRTQPRYLGAVGNVGMGLTTAGYALTRGLPAVLLLTMVAGVTTAVGRSAGQAIVARLGADDAAAFRARNMAVSASGQMLSAAILGAVLAVGSLTAYDTTLICTVPLQSLAALAVLRTGHLKLAAAGQTVRRRRSWMVLRDRTYLRVIALCTFFQLRIAVQLVGVPLWMIRHTDLASQWRAGYFVAGNLGVVLFMVRMGRRITSVTAAGRAMAGTGLTLAIVCVAAVGVHHTTGVAAVLIFLVLIASDVAAMVLYYAAENELTMSLAPPDRRGEYLGLLLSSEGVALSAGPAICAVIVSTYLDAGWLTLAAVSVVTGLLALTIRRTESLVQQCQAAFGGEVADGAPGPLSGDEPAIAQDAKVLRYGARRHVQFPGEIGRRRRRSQRLQQPGPAATEQADSAAGHRPGSRFPERSGAASWVSHCRLGRGAQFDHHPVRAEYHR